MTITKLSVFSAFTRSLSVPVLSLLVLLSSGCTFESSKDLQPAAWASCRGIRSAFLRVETKHWYFCFYIFLGDSNAQTGLAATASCSNLISFVNGTLRGWATYSCSQRRLF